MCSRVLAPGLTAGRFFLRARRSACSALPDEEPRAHRATMQAFLRALLTQVTPEVKALLEPKGDGDKFTFRPCEGLFIAWGV